ncbi:MAG TPA: serine hydrolase [Micromonosporaceae bacterium]|jgi:beta-lactamase class A|nr:serine hydrolase [Micromonosporaceae bacterium]
MTPVHLTALDDELAAVPGTVSVHCGPLDGPPAYAREWQATHYAASTMKVAVLAALYRSGVDLDAPVPVHNEFRSAAPGAPAFHCTPEYDSETEVWRRIGGTASLRWLAWRMIVVSGNLATNLCLAEVGLPAVNAVWRLVGARHSVVGRGIQDTAAGDAGISNLVTAADLAALLSAIARADPALSTVESCDGMREVLLAQERGEDLAAGLPPGTRIAHKNGWIPGIRHGAAVIYPADAPAYTLVCCTSTPLATDSDGTDAACALLARVAAASWADRYTLTP